MARSTLTGRYVRERRSSRYQRGDGNPTVHEYWVREVCGEPVQCWLAEATAIVKAGSWAEAIEKYRAGDWAPGPAAVEAA